MKILRKIALPVLLVGLAAPAAAQDAPDPTSASASAPVAGAQGPVSTLDPDVAKTAELLLSGHHGLPARAVFEARVPETRDVLTAYATDPEVFALYRKRALRALGWWADDEVLAIYREALVDRATEEMTRHAVLMLLAEHFGAEAVASIAVYLSNPDVQLRLTAVEALRRVESEAAQSALREALDGEQDAVVRARLEAATRVIR